jgi:hypothetical protein
LVDAGSFALGLIAAIPGYVGLFFTYWRGRLQFELERFQEKSSSPVESVWSIRIQHPTRAIDHCSVFLDTYPLPAWDKAEKINEIKIQKDSGAVFRIPSNLSPFGVVTPGKITVKDGKRVVRKQMFLDIPDVTPR